MFPKAIIGDAIYSLKDLGLVPKLGKGSKHFIY